MARGVNKAIIVGNLGGDPETRYTQSGTAITNINVATSESWTDKQSGEKKEKTEWHKIVFFNRLAEIAGEYLEKGAQVYIEGKIQTEKWTDNEGVERYTTKIIASELQMLGSRGAQGGESRTQHTGGFRDRPKSQPQEPAQGDAFGDDEIPF